jgi:hypothetical protein
MLLSRDPVCCAFVLLQRCQSGKLEGRCELHTKFVEIAASSCTTDCGPANEACFSDTGLRRTGRCLSGKSIVVWCGIDSANTGSPRHCTHVFECLPSKGSEVGPCTADAWPVIFIRLLLVCNSRKALAHSRPSTSTFTTTDLDLRALRPRLRLHLRRRQRHRRRRR